MPATAVQHYYVRFCMRVHVSAGAHPLLLLCVDVDVPAQRATDRAAVAWCTFGTMDAMFSVYVWYVTVRPVCPRG